jgi:putative membrane protein
MNRSTHFMPLLSALVLAIMGMTSASAQTTTNSATTPATTTTTTSTTTTATDGRKVDRSDANFLKEAVESGFAEIEGGKLALSKATHPDVKAFAQMLVDDHAKANIELATLAASKNVAVSSEPSMVAKAKLKVLAMRETATFDKHFIKTMGVDAHEDTIKRFEKANRDAKDADVKAFVTKTLPTLQHHLQMAKDLHAKLDPKDAKK